MNNQSAETNLLGQQITKFKANLGTRFGKIKGYLSSTLEGEGGRMDAVADSILQGIKDGYTTKDIANMSFVALQQCSKTLADIDRNNGMDFIAKEKERQQIYAILTHIENVNRKIPHNASELKAKIKTDSMDGIWVDIDAIREEQQDTNWMYLKGALMALVCALIIAVFIGAMVTGWPAVGAFIIGAIVHVVFPQLTQIISAMVVAAVTVGLWKGLRPIDKYAAETKLSALTAAAIEEQKRKSTDELTKFNTLKAKNKPAENEATQRASARPLSQRTGTSHPVESSSSTQSSRQSGPNVVPSQARARQNPQSRVWDYTDDSENEQARPMNRQLLPTPKTVEPEMGHPSNASNASKSREEPSFTNTNRSRKPSTAHEQKPIDSDNRGKGPSNHSRNNGGSFNDMRSGASTRRSKSALRSNQPLESESDTEENEQPYHRGGRQGRRG